MMVGDVAMVLVRRLWRSTLMVTHISSGLVLLVATGALWQPYNPLTRRTMQWWLGRVTRILNIETQLRGHIPHEQEGAVLLVSNHVSWVDIPLIGSVTPVSFLSKAEVAKWPVIGTLASKVGTLFIQRGAGNTESVSLAIADTLRRNKSVLFFPEGTTTDGKSLKRFHSKLFKVCHHHSVTLLPVVVRYGSDSDSNPIPFIGDDEFTQHLWNLMGHRKLYACIDVLAPVKLEAHTLTHQIAELEAAMRATVEQAHVIPNEESRSTRRTTPATA